VQSNNSFVKLSVFAYFLLCPHYPQYRCVNGVIDRDNFLTMSAVMVTSIGAILLVSCHALKCYFCANDIPATRSVYTIPCFDRSLLTKDEFCVAERFCYKHDLVNLDGIIIYSYLHNSTSRSAIADNPRCSVGKFWQKYK